MKQILIKDLKVNICRDIIEWAKEFYEMPEGAILDNEEEVSNECMGFSCPEDKEMWIFIPANYDIKNSQNIHDIQSTVAHEAGHLTTIDYLTTKVPADELEELKAEHYEAFYLLVDSIVIKILQTCN